MRDKWLSGAWVAVAVTGVGCGSDTFAPADGAVADASGDGADSADSAGDTAPDSASSFECRDPGDCSAIAKHCCATFQLGAGSLPTCPVSGAATACKAVCATEIPLACPASAEVKICRNAADCADDAQALNCCTILAASMVGTFCVGDLVKSYAQKCF